MLIFFSVNVFYDRRMSIGWLIVIQSHNLIIFKCFEKVRKWYLIWNFFWIFVFFNDVQKTNIIKDIFKVGIKFVLNYTFLIFIRYIFDYREFSKSYFLQRWWIIDEKFNMKRQCNAPKVYSLLHLNFELLFCDRFKIIFSWH